MSVAGSPNCGPNPEIQALSPNNAIEETVCKLRRFHPAPHPERWRSSRLL
jgi:hypothetical protein